jgi:hypothetical protein
VSPLKLKSPIFPVTRISLVILLKSAAMLPFSFKPTKANHHHHKHQALVILARSVSAVTAAIANVSSVSQLFFFPVDCKDKAVPLQALTGLEGG